MSSDYHACNGYVIKITEDVINAFNITKELLVNQFGVDYADEIDNSESVLVVLGQIAYYEPHIYFEIGGIPVNARLFQTDEEYGGDIEINESYIIFEQSDIYEVKPTPLLDALVDRNVKPELLLWTVYS